jgi:hypothetical protein
MNHGFIVPSLLLVGCVLLGQAQPPVFKKDQLVGSWKVSWERSKPDAADTVSQVPSLYRQYEDSVDGWMLHTVIAVDPTQSNARLLVVAAVKYDGNEYPTFAGKRLAAVLSSGKEPVQTVAFRARGVRSYSLIRPSRGVHEILLLDFIDRMHAFNHRHGIRAKPF